MMPIQVTSLTESDIQGAITTIQLAFADDPYNRWVYDDRSKVNSLDLSLFSSWGMVISTRFDQGFQ
jgi:hypothetical protein